MDRLILSLCLCLQATEIQGLQDSDDLLNLGVDSLMANVICTVSSMHHVLLVIIDVLRLCVRDEIHGRQRIWLQMKLSVTVVPAEKMLCWVDRNLIKGKINVMITTALKLLVRM